MSMETKNKPLILYVDDEVELCDLFSELLEMNNYKVVKAHSGNQALQILKKQKVDAVVSDIQMPNGDGLYLLSEVKKLDSPPPLIFTTGFAPVTRAQTLEMGAVDCLSKPFSEDALVNAIQRALNGKTATNFVATETQATRHIYYAEDSDLDFDLLKEAITRLKIPAERFKIHRFIDGADLVSSLNPVNTRVEETPSLFILDINMPKMSGIEALSEIRKISTYSSTPALILTSSNLHTDKESANKAGANAFYTKPLGIAGWQHMVQSWEQSWLVEARYTKYK